MLNVIHLLGHYLASHKLRILHNKIFINIVPATPHQTQAPPQTTKRKRTKEKYHIVNEKLFGIKI